jgi:acyl-CoA reductase-like NAD-dependent aldehyde dehydrogenase
VFADADLDKAVFWSALGAFGNAGQICVCGSRIIVQRPIYEEFSDRLKAAAEALVVGDPLDPATQLGPMIAASHAAKVWQYIDVARHEGRIITGGEPYKDAVRSGGAFVPPTVVVDVTPTCRVATEEIFGPVVTLLPFDTLSEAVAIANETTQYGLSAGLFTRSLDTAWAVARRLKAGQVYVNQWFSPGVLEAPAHGYKRSGYGGAGVEKYSQHKQVFFHTSEPKI